jgi:hypothetical protein
MTTPMSTTTSLDADEDGEPMDMEEYRSMIGFLLYLTITRSDIQFSVCLCAGFQASLRTYGARMCCHVDAPNVG